SQQELVAEMEKIPLVLDVPVPGTNAKVKWEAKAVNQESSRIPIDEANNYATRRYVSRDGTWVHVMITRGRPGPLVVKHLPTECYPSNGFDLVGQPAGYLLERADG